MKDKTERKLKKVVINLMRNPTFADWSGILMLGKKQLDDNLPTAMTDGRDEAYGRKFVEMLNEKELGFVVLHEAGHKMFRHLFTWRKLFEENPQLCNAACDYVINLMLKNRDPDEQFIAMPRINGQVVGLIDTRFAGMNAKQVYDILKQEAKGGGKGQKGKGQPGDGQPGGGGGGDLPEGFDEHDWGGAKELSKEERDQLTREIDQAIRQGQIAAQKVCGTGAGNMDRTIADLLEPKVDWREQLREFTTSICNAKDTSSWRRINRRFVGQDIFLPTLIGERVGRIIIGVDTSGSIGQDELTAALSETMAVVEHVKPEHIDLIYWDHAVAAHEEYDMGAMGNLATSTKPRGGGGTDPTCMLNYLKEKKIEAECIIQFTDGCIGNWGDDWGVPIMWVIIGGYGKSTYAPCGKTIHIDD
jgi:predicted metal-dependent peptidase